MGVTAKSVKRTRKRKSNCRCPHGDSFLNHNGREIYCRECARIHFQSTRLKAVKMLGDKCVCCGSSEKLTFDHIEAVRWSQTGRRIGGASLSYEVIRSPKHFQLLCYPCNRRKQDGPWCPCGLWKTLTAKRVRELAGR